MVLIDAIYITTLGKWFKRKTLPLLLVSIDYFISDY